MSWNLHISRGQFFWGCLAVAMFVLMIAFLIVGGLVGLPVAVSIFLAVGATGLFLWKTSEFWFLFVPEATGIVTMNIFNRTYHGWAKPGLYLRYPWEKIHKQNFFSLKTLVTEVFSEDFPTKQSDEKGKPKGGAMVIVKWLYQWKTLDTPGAMVKRLLVDNTTISDGVKGLVSGKLTEMISGMSADDARNKIDEINRGVEAAVKEKKEGDKYLLVDIYGIELVIITVTDIDFEKSYQEARSAAAEADQTKAIVDKIRGEKPEIPEKDAWNLALIMRGKVKKVVMEAEGEGIKGLASLLMGIFRGGDKGDAK